MTSIVYDNKQWWPEDMTPFCLQSLSNNDHRQYMYSIIDANIYDVIEVLKEIFPQDRTNGSSFLAAQNLLPPIEIATIAEVHQWVGTFTQHTNNGKLTTEEVRQVIDFQKKNFPRKTSFHSRIHRLLHPSNENYIAPLEAYVTRVFDTLTKEAKKVNTMQPEGYEASVVNFPLFMCCVKVPT